jgi:hypothetical protein
MINPARRFCTVLIARPESLPVLETKTRRESDEFIALSDAEPLRALEVITERRPDVIALEHIFAATARGAAFITRLRADPLLSHSEIKVVGGDDHEPAAVDAAPPRAPVAPSTPLDQAGTRQTERFRIVGQLEVLVDGNQAVLVDLSTSGAQLISPTVLRPNQRVRISLADEHSAIRCVAIVAWASFEIPPKTGPRYRAGLEFFNADAAAIHAFCSRHRETSY